MSSAVVGDGNADITDLDISGRAFEADLVVPVPGLASEVSRSLGFISNTFSINDRVSLVAGSADS